MPQSWYSTHILQECIPNRGDALPGMFQGLRPCEGCHHERLSWSPDFLSQKVEKKLYKLQSHSCVDDLPHQNLWALSNGTQFQRLVSKFVPFGKFTWQWNIQYGPVNVLKLIKKVATFNVSNYPGLKIPRLQSQLLLFQLWRSSCFSRL